MPLLLFVLLASQLLMIFGLAETKTTDDAKEAFIPAGSDAALAEPCVLLMYTLNPTNYEVLELNSKYGVYSVDDPETRFWDYHFSPGFGQAFCIIGLAPLEKISELQLLMSNATANKLIVSLNKEEESTNISSTIYNSLDSVDKRHHPIQFAWEERHREMVKVDVLCRASKILKRARVLRTQHWIPNDIINADNIERFCNNGHHMLYGKMLKASTFGVKPFLFVNEESSEVSGVAIDLVGIVSKHLNFTVDFLLFPTWAGLDEEGNFYSLTTKVFDGTADFALEDPIQAADVLDPPGSFTRGWQLYNSDSTFVTPAPPRLSQIWNIVFVWDKTCWIFFFVSFATVTITHSLVCYQIMGESFLDSMWIPYGILFQEFHDWSPVWTQHNVHLYLPMLTRMVWVISSGLLVMAFCGNLKATLMINRYEDRILSLDEMVDQGLTVWMSEAVYHLMLGMDTELTRKILDRVIERGTINVWRDHEIAAMDDMLSGGISAAVLPPEPTLYQKNERLKQGLAFPIETIPETLLEIDMCYAFPYNSPMREMFDRVTMRISDSGIIEELFERHSPFRSMKDEVFFTKQTADDLIIEHILIFLCIWVGGTALSVLLFLAERRFDRKTDAGGRDRNEESIVVWK